MEQAKHARTWGDEGTREKVVGYREGRASPVHCLKLRQSVLILLWQGGVQEALRETLF